MKGFYEIDDISKPIKSAPKSKIVGCETCGSYKECMLPKIAPVGKGEKKILILFGSPTRKEDRKKYPFFDDFYTFTWNAFIKAGINVMEDAWVMHSIQCHQGPKPNAKAIPGCNRRLLDFLDDHKPEKIFVMDMQALQVLYHGRTSGRFSFTGYDKFVGWQIPDQEFGARVIPILDPRDVLDPLEFRKKMAVQYNKFEPHPGFLWENPSVNYVDEFRLKKKIFEKQIADGLKSTKVVKTNYDETVMLTEDPDEAIGMLRGLMKAPAIAFDTETTGLKPHADGHDILIWGFSDGLFSYGFPNFKDEKFQRVLKRLLTNPSIPKYGANIKYEHNWIRELLGYEIQGWELDTVIASHILDNRQGITSLKFQTFVQLGVLGYDEVIDPYLGTGDKSGNSINRLREADQVETAKYCALDALFTFKLAEKFKKVHNDYKRASGYKLFHEGTLALSDIESRGILVDEKKLLENDLYLEKELYRLDREIMATEEVSKYDTPNFNYGSNKDLSRLLFDILQYPVIKRTPTGEPSTDKDSLEEIARLVDSPFITKLLERKSAEKIKNTFLAGIKRETVEGVIHPGFALNTVSSYRSSSQWPNFQNLSKHDEFAKKMIKSVLIPRPGYTIKEFDYKSLESFMGANYHKDSTMMKYLMDESTDMHRDSAADVFKCSTDEVTKDMRQVGKTFNFAMQYGISGKNLANNLWNMQMNDTHKEFLKGKGVESFEDFTNHMRSLYDNFWNVRFKELGQWRDSLWEDYIDKGEIISYTGFAYNSVMTKNQVGNFPVQGSGFHCLMFGINELNKEIKKRGLKSGIIAEIHDSCVVEVHESESAVIDELVFECLVTRVEAKFSWMTMPLAIEADVYPKNWAESTESYPLPA